MTEELNLILESERRFRLLVEAVRDYAIYMLDREGRITTWNVGAERIKGYTSEEVIGKHFSLFFLPGTIQAGTPAHLLEMATKDGQVAGEGWRVRKDGSRFWASVILNAIRDDHGELIGFAKVTRDLTESKRQADALRVSEANLQVEKNRLQLTLDSIADGVISTDSEQRITLINPVGAEMTGWDIGSAIGRRADEVAIFEDAKTGLKMENPIRTALEQHMALQSADGSVLISKDGQRHDVLESSAPIRTADGETLGAVLVFQDVTRLRSALREMEFNRTHDALTQLPNRTLFRVHLENALAHTRETGIESTVCFLDLDRFKIINDTAGHIAGDMLLQLIAQSLAQSVSEPDFVARLGGDEFAILFFGRTIEESEEDLLRILKQISDLGFPWERQIFQISASAGVAAATADLDVAMVMKRADVACYAAKNSGRNRLSIYRAEQGEGFDRHQELQIASDIKSAIQQDRFSLYAQKICSMEGPTQAVYEVLLRMYGHDGTMLSPAQFIPAAERYDLMGEVDRWVLKRVMLHHADRLKEIHGIRISINLSANSLNDPTFLPFFLKLLAESALDPHSLIFEVTETALIGNLLSASKVIEGIRAAGCGVALDDFGIGMSSFSYLREFKVDFIKIEGSFVRNISENTVDYAIVKAINNVAHEIDTLTVAEYVENDAIIDSLRLLGVDYAQGYALGRPGPFELIFAAANETAPVAVAV